MTTLVCPRIAHCNHRNCSRINDNNCLWCDGDLIADKPKWRAYIPYPPDKKNTCRRK